MNDGELEPLYVKRREQLKELVASIIRPKIVQGKSLNGKEFVSFLEQVPLYFFVDIAFKNYHFFFSYRKLSVVTLAGWDMLVIGSSMSLNLWQVLSQCYKELNIFYFLVNLNIFSWLQIWKLLVILVTNSKFGLDSLMTVRTLIVQFVWLSLLSWVLSLM